MKHTPAPWLFDKTGYTVLPNGTEISQSYTISTDKTYNRKSIARIEAKKEEGDILNQHLYNVETCEANARLIAAAPIMFDYIEQRAKQGDEEAIQLIESIHAN